MKIYAYKMGSGSAKALAEALNIKRVKHEGKTLKMKGTLINWGSSAIARHVLSDRILNLPSYVKNASNKLSTFNILKDAGVSIPEFTTAGIEAARWLEEKATVVARHKLTGHSGEGIEIIEPKGDAEVFGYKIPNAPLYTKYINKAQEYRIHVFGNEAFFVQRKARKKEVPDDQVNWKIRNHANGFIFAHQNVEVPEQAKVEAIKAVKALGLDFGAVDIIESKRNGIFYVLEVNTACGLEGETLNKYVQKFEQFR